MSDERAVTAASAIVQPLVRAAGRIIAGLPRRVPPARRPARTTLVLAIILVPAYGTPAATAVWQTPPDAVIWDAYRVGIHLAELTLRGDSLTIRHKDPATNTWLPPRTASAAEIGSHPAFRLWSAIAELPARLPELESVGWGTSPAVGWPDDGTIYVPHERTNVLVGGLWQQATRWVARDASNPLDLMVDSAGGVVAAIGLSADVVLVRRGWEDATTVGRWRRAGVSDAAYGYRGLGKQMVAMRDGVRLATLVYLPDGPGAEAPFPVIFVRTPYGIGELIERYWHYAARGYAVVLQAARGTAYWDPYHRSEGEWGYFRNEAADGEDALGWVVSQPWSNGEVCTHGGSYLGYTQWTQTIAGNPALKCIIPEVSMGTVFSDQPYWGGGFVAGILYYLTWMLDKHPIAEGTSWTEVFRHRPLLSMDRFATGEDIPQWKALIENWINGEYWAPQDWYAADVPREFASFSISGWWDDDLPGTTANWALVREEGAAPRRLMLGPWKHGYNLDRALNGFSFGYDAVRGDIWLLKQMWFDRFLKGMQNVVDEHVVEYFVLGENEWRTAPDWPPPEAERTALYLGSDGRAERSMISGRLSLEPPTSPGAPDEYVYDPERAVSNWMSFDRLTRWEDQQTWPYDFKDIEGRSDVAVYTSEPLPEDLTIAGEPMLVLFASTDVMDTDWWVHISDVHPNGTSKRLSTGVLRARFREREDPQHGALGQNYKHQKLLSGDIEEVVEYRIGLRAIANTFRKGHQIRVAIYNALENFQFPNSNMGVDEGRVTRTVPGTMRIHHSPGRESSIVLPILPTVRAPVDD